MVVKFKKLKADAILPKNALPGDSGMDIFSAEDYLLKPHEWHTFSTGIASEISPGFFMRLAPKSGLAVKHGIDTLAGVIDPTYRGEWFVVLVNHGNEPKEFKKGDKLAQAILQRFETVEVLEVQELSETERKERGFGSSGR